MIANDWAGGGARKDAVRNRQRLLEAAGEIIRTSPEEATMPKIAKAAGLSTATAYRYYPTLGELLNHYLYSVLVQLRDFSHDCPATGLELYSRVIDEWIRLVHVYGRTMVQLRPRTGLLARLRAHDSVITASRDAWERPIRAVLRSERLADDTFEPAFFLHNLMFDAREILDLSDLGLSDDEIKRRMVSAFKGAIRGWANFR
ncbi:TetR/AcrR family transcriptional regulator [Nonomuraea sp. NPDC049269]|uniref:TetR/AcrR family transcriptional regulator n=1 Tax=Nonomuraea sp. NPDC049269 TaxID=3364349 RepID=UPI003721DB6A